MLSIKYIMPGTSLNTQTNREIRYEQRSQQKRVHQQNMDRNCRAEKRVNMLAGISNEVADEISLIINTRRGVPKRGATNNVSFSSYF